MSDFFDNLLNIIIANWPYLLFAVGFAVFCLSVLVYQFKDRRIKKQMGKSLEKSKSFKKYHVTEVDPETLREKEDLF